MFDHNAYQKEYYKKNKEKINAREKLYRESNPDTIRETQKRYYLNNIEFRRKNSINN